MRHHTRRKHTTASKMKHGKFARKLGRDTAHRWAMLRTMVTQLIEHERIETTVAKAKELRRLADKVVTYAKAGTLMARRQAGAIVRTDSMMQKLFTEFADRYKERKVGPLYKLGSSVTHSL